MAFDFGCFLSAPFVYEGWSIFGDMVDCNDEGGVDGETSCREQKVVLPSALFWRQLNCLWLHNFSK